MLIVCSISYENNKIERFILVIPAYMIAVNGCNYIYLPIFINIYIIYWLRIREGYTSLYFLIIK